MAAKYDGKTAAEWREVADDAQYQASHTVNDDTKDYWLGVYRTATLKASIADGLEDDNDTPSGGGDTIPNYDYNISNFTNDTIISGTTNADIIYSMASNVTIQSGDGSDTVRIAARANSANTNVVINGEEDNDRLENYGADKALIDGGAGNDTIDNWGKNVTISGGTGDDSINLARGGATNCLIKYNSGDGNDTVVGFVTSSSLSIASGDYSTTKSDSDIIVTVGEGKIILVGAAVLPSVNIQGSLSGGGDDTSSGGSSDPKLITGTNGDDSIVNTIEGAIIQALDGNDTIDNGSYNGDYHFGGNNVSIDGGQGNDKIFNRANNILISGGVGDDTINNYDSDNVTILGGAGNDYIFSNFNSTNVTINAGKGDDTIESYGKNVLFIYNDGDGNDFINEFDSTSTLQIGDGTGTYSTVMSGNDVIVNVGEGKITLSGVLSLGTWNIRGTLVNGTEYDDNIHNTLESATINALGGNDTIRNDNANNVKIAGGAGDDSISNGYRKDRFFSSSDDLNGGDNVSITGGEGNDTIYNHNASNVSISGGLDNDRIENILGSNVTIDAGAGDDSITNHDYLKWWRLVGDIVSSGTINGGEGNDSIQNYSASVSINGGADNDYITNSGSSVTIDGGDGADTIENHKDNTTIDAGTGNDSIDNSGSAVTIFGGDGNDYIYNKNCDNVSINGGAGNDSIYTGGRYLRYDKKVDGGFYVSINGGVGNDLISLGSYASYNFIHYAEGDGKDTIYGFNETTTLQIAASNYSTKKSGDDIIVTVGKGKITLSGAARLSSANINFAKTEWKLNGTTATYGTSNNTLVTVNGVKSLDGISLSGTKVTLSEAALGTDNVTISDGYKLALGKNVTKSSKTKAWSLNKTTATYEHTTTAGYTLADNVITYVPKLVETLATVEGVKAVDGLKISGKTITVSAASLNKKNVTVSDGYTLKLGTDVTKSSKTKAWSLSKTTATYKQTTTAGYTLADNAITYSPKSIETLATVKGVKAVDGLKISGKTITVSEASLNKKNVTVSDGYTLKLGSDVTKPITKTAAWKFSGSTATYKSSYKTAGYTLADNQISYAKATTATTLATVKGAKSADGLSVSGSKITLKNAALANKVTVSGGYEFDFAKDYTNATITGSKNNDTITARGTKVLINAGAGDDTIKMLGSTITVKGGSGNDLFVYSTGNNVIADYETGDKISIGAAISSSSFKDTDATFKIGSKTLTVKNGKGKEITFIDASGTERTIIGGAYLAMNNTSSKVTIAASREVGDATARTNPIRLTGNAKDNTILGGSNDDSLYGGAGNDSLMGNAGNDLLSGGSGDDYVIGGEGNDKLYGYTGNDTLIGGAGNDSLWGQAGADTFVYSNGNDIIYGFDDNDMLTLDGLDFTASVENDAVKFTTVNDGSIILKDFTATTFHVNGDTYAISNNKLVKQ